MELSDLFLVAAAINAVSGKDDQCAIDSSHKVQTLTGTYTGIIDPEFPNTRQYRAVPFAQAPVGALRWAPPQKLPPSTEHHYATRFPPSCPQFVSGIPNFFNSDLTRGNLIYNGFQNDTSGLVGEATSEDCLYVAVWTPTTPPPEDGFPVLFFMTGGGFFQGGIDIPWQMPTSWVERSQSHIVVTINYRVNIFGFPNAKGLPNEKGQQNVGILDMRAALEWVHENIASFGGNPSRITAWGRSAAGIGVDMLGYAYHEDPIAQGYWMQSGTASSGGFPTTPSYSNFTYIAQHVGCNITCGDDDGAAELDCMRQVPFAMIENFMGQFIDSGEDPYFGFYPIADEEIVFTDYNARAEAGLIARVPTVISNVANELSSLLLSPKDNLTTGPDPALVLEYDVLGYVCPTFNATVYRNRIDPDLPVFRFQHAGVFPNLNKYPWLGAYHASDIPISFGTYHLLDHIANTTQLEIDVSRSMQDHILAFVKDPYNGPQTLGWMPMNTSAPNGGDLIRFGAKDNVLQHIDGIEVDGVCLGLREYNNFP